MKRTVCIMALAILFIISCKKNKADTADVDSPALTLSGRASDTAHLEGTYTDPGATASDSKDGDLSAYIIVTGVVNTTLAGNYTKDYTVSDAAGNVAKATRRIHVKNDVEFLAGQYLVTCHCATIQAGSAAVENDITYNAVPVISSIANNSFTVNLKNGSGAPASIPLNASGAAIQGTVSSGTLSGNIAAGGNGFTIYTTIPDPQVAGKSYTSTNIYIKL